MELRLDRFSSSIASRAAGAFALATTLSLAACSPPATTDAGDVARSDATGDLTSQGDAPRTDGPATMDIVPSDVPAPIDAADAPPAPDASDAAPPVDGNTDGGDGGPGCTLRHVVVTTTDFMTGGYAIGDLATRTLRVVAPPAGDGGVRPEQDHIVRTSGCIAFDLWRTVAARPNALVVLDPDNLYVPRHSIPLDPVPGVGDAGGPQSADPYDVAVLTPTRAYVTQYNSADVQVVDPSRDGTAARLGAISLAAFGGADGIPEAASIARVGTRLYVAVQQLDRTAGFPWHLPAHSQVAVIDTTRGTYGEVQDLDPATDGVQGIALSAANPQARMAVSPDGRYLLVASGGDYGSNTDGALDVIDTTTNRVVRTVAPAALGGDPNSVEVVAGTTAWAALDVPMGDAAVRHVIVAFDYVSGAVTAAPVAQSPTVAYGELRRAPDGTVWAIDTGFDLNGTVHAFSSTGMPLLAMPFVTAGTNTYSLDFAP